jgi:hypothetical protein
MKTALEYALAEFTDRKEELKRFCELLDSREKPIIFVSGCSGMGKSQLLARMWHECSLRQLAKSSIAWTGSQNHDYLAVLRWIRDELGTEHFNSFTSLVNAYFDERVKVDLNVVASGNISVAAGAQFTNASVGSITGVVISDCMFTLPRRDLGVHEVERRQRLTRAFVSDLKLLAQQGPIVLFFDAVEKMSEETRGWMWEMLMEPVRDGEILALTCVHFGLVLPELDRDMNRAVESTELHPWGLHDIEDYLVKRNIQCASLPEIATLLMAGTKGVPIQVATMVDSFERMNQSRKAGP